MINNIYEFWLSPKSTPIVISQIYYSISKPGSKPGYAHLGHHIITKIKEVILVQKDKE